MKCCACHTCAIIIIIQYFSTKIINCTSSTNTNYTNQYTKLLAIHSDELLNMKQYPTAISEELIKAASRCLKFNQRLIVTIIRQVIEIRLVGIRREIKKVFKVNDDDDLFAVCYRVRF